MGSVNELAKGSIMQERQVQITLNLSNHQLGLLSFVCRVLNQSRKAIIYLRNGLVDPGVEILEESLKPITIGCMALFQSQPKEIVLKPDEVLEEKVEIGYSNMTTNPKIEARGFWRTELHSGSFLARYRLKSYQMFFFSGDDELRKLAKERRMDPLLGTHYSNILRFDIE